MQINRENILGNRESFSGNREFLRDFGKRPFLTHLFDWPWPRSVLTGKVAGEEDGDLERDRLAGARKARRFGGSIMRRGSKVR